MPSARRKLVAIALALVCAASAALASERVAEASPEDILGFGARSSAMGATGAASAEGYEAVYANPALLSLARSREITIGIQGVAFDLHAHQKVSYEAMKGSVIGAVLPLPFGGILKDRIALGVGFFTPFDLIVRGRILYPEVPQFPLADRTQSLAIQAGLGVDIGHGVRIGGGFAALAALSGTVLVATDATGKVGTTVDDTLVASYAPTVGVSYETPGGAYRFGATFRGTLVGRFNVQITVKDLGDLTVPPLNISGTAQYDPWQLAFEVARVKGPWKLALGVTYKHWGAYPGAAEQTVRCPVLDPDTGKPFTADCNPAKVPPPEFHSTVSPRAGVERTFEPAEGVGIALRGGVLVEPSPAPSQTKASNIYDNTRVAVTLGYGVQLGPPFPKIDFDLFGQLHALIPETHVKGDSVSAADVAAAGAKSVTSSGFVGAAGATVGVKF